MNIHLFNTFTFIFIFIAFGLYTFFNTFTFIFIAFGNDFADRAFQLAEKPEKKAIALKKNLFQKFEK